MPSILDLPPEQRFQMLVQAVVDYAIFLLDEKGNIASWNSGAQRIKGYRAEEAIGSHFSIFYTPEDRRNSVPQTALKTAAEKGKYEAEGWRVRKDGTRFYASVLIDAVRSERGELLGFAKVTRDITERKQAEQQLLEAREQLLQSQKLDSIGQLTGGIAHDFNNLLTVIVSAAQMMERLAHGNDQLLRLIGHTRSAVERGEKLTRQLLAYSRRQTLKPQLLDLAEALQEFNEGILQTVRTNIEVRLDLAGGIWPVEADPNELQLALLNIALNARDAMPNGGKLTVTLRNEHIAPIGQTVPGRYVAISLIDTGLGMSAETLSRATEPFYTTKPPGTGTGLGLSQAYGFAKQSGGSLHFESALGRGTTVTLYLPAAQLSSSEPAPRSGAKGLTVLVVEDEVLVAEMAKSMLVEAGYRVEVAHDANQGLDILRKTKVDALFSDIVMPGGMNGIELAETARKENPSLPILLTSGYYQATEQVSSRHRVLPKPYDETALLSALESALDVG
ncbi:MAG TPA: PAS domain S-box protein [Aestuariivirgaceae bacterium]|jgi:PAS domain S-box-containing protein